MKRFNWVLIGVMISVLAIVLLAGCVSKSEFEALQAEQAALVQEKASLTAELQRVQSDLTKVQADYEATNNELAEIKEVYPPRDFSSLKELRDWLQANDVSARPTTEFAEGWYSKALEIQEDALKDGYIISAWIEYYPDTDTFVVFCTAVVDGYVWGWDPEADELYNFSDATGLLKLT